MVSTPGTPQHGGQPPHNVQQQQNYQAPPQQQHPQSFQLQPQPQYAQPQPQYVQQSPHGQYPPQQQQQQQYQGQPQGQPGPVLVQQTTATNQSVNFFQPGVAIPLDRKSAEYKNLKKDANALVWFLHNRDKYHAKMKKIAERPISSFCAMNDEIEKPNKSNYYRSDVCTMECFSCCCLTSCYAPYLRASIYNESCCEACLFGCLCYACTGPSLHHEVLRLAGLEEHENKIGAHWLAHCCCCQPCMMAKNYSIFDFYRHKRWGWSLVRGITKTASRALKGKSGSYKQSREKRSHEWAVPYPAMSEFVDPTKAIEFRQRTWGNAPAIVMDPTTKRFVGTTTTNLATVITTTSTPISGQTMIQQPGQQPGYQPQQSFQQSQGQYPQQQQQQQQGQYPPQGQYQQPYSPQGGYVPPQQQPQQYQQVPSPQQQYQQVPVQQQPQQPAPYQESSPNLKEKDAPPGYTPQ